MNLYYFLPAFLLLMFPSDRLIPARAQLRTLEDLNDVTQRRRFWLWMHPLGFLRAGLGTWLLIQSFTTETDAALWDLREFGPLGFTIGTLLVAVVVQTITRRDPDYSLAPVLFVCGLIVALLPWEISTSALVLSLASMFAFRNWMVFFVVGALTIGGAGVLWETPKLLLAAACALTVFPALIAFTSGRILTMPSRQ